MRYDVAVVVDTHATSNFGRDLSIVVFPLNSCGDVISYLINATLRWSAHTLNLIQS